MAHFFHSLFILFTLTCSILAAPLTSQATYQGDVVLRFNVTDSEELRTLLEASESLYLDVWEATNRWVDLRVSKVVVPSLLSSLPEPLQHAYTPLIHDLAQAIDESRPSGDTRFERQPLSLSSRITQAILNRPQYHSDDVSDIFFREYQPLSAISAWMELMAAMFPSHVERINIGHSYEGRDIPAVRVGVKPQESNDPVNPRKTIIVVGGSHAREWISTSTVNYVASNFITRYGEFPGITKLINEFDWVFIPTVNPDGYVYTWEQDRLWRKNRQQTDLRFCKGLDLDRAWGFQWNGESTRSNPCSENYAGLGPFEAAEAKAVADWARNETENSNVQLVAFLDLHSYSQQILYPYSYSCSTPPNGLENLMELAYGMQKASRLTHDQFYEVRSACESSLPSSATGVDLSLGGGSAIDYFYETFRVKFAYQIKLRDTGSYGFLLPKSNIVPTGQEIYNSITWAIGHFILNEDLVHAAASRKGAYDRDTEIQWAQELLR